MFGAASTPECATAAYHETVKDGIEQSGKDAARLRWQYQQRFLHFCQKCREGLAFFTGPKPRRAWRFSGTGKAFRRFDDCGQRRSRLDFHRCIEPNCRLQA